MKRHRVHRSSPSRTRRTAYRRAPRVAASNARVRRVARRPVLALPEPVLRRERLLNTRRALLPLSVLALSLRSPRLSRTVRPLIRTVRTDTARRHLHLRSRPSPDVLAAARPWLPPSSNQVIFGGASLSLPVFSPLATPSADKRLHKAFVCAKRSIRRSVLLAKNQGNGAGSRGKPKSKLEC